VVITTAVVPGKKAPVLVTREMVKGMAPGSVIFDLAAERGGNCELTCAGQTVFEHGVTIIGRINVASQVPYHASQMYGRNITRFSSEPGKEWKAAVRFRRRNYSRDSFNPWWRDRESAGSRVFRVAGADFAESCLVGPGVGMVCPPLTRAGLRSKTLDALPLLGAIAQEHKECASQILRFMRPISSPAPSRSPP